MINKWEISAKSILYQLHKPERAITYIEQHNLDSVAHRSRQPVNRSTYLPEQITPRKKESS